MNNIIKSNNIGELDYSLSNEDIDYLLEYSGYFTLDQIYIVPYNELQGIDLATLPQGSAIIILYRTAENYGHWTTIYRPETTRGKLFFFDSMGDYTDDSLYDNTIFNQKKNIELGQTRKLLTEKAYEGGYDIEYLDYECQSQKNGINTCGKWVVFFLIFSKMVGLKELESLKRFLRIIKKEYNNEGLTLDDFVNNIIITIINKKNI